MTRPSSVLCSGFILAAALLSVTARSQPLPSNCYGTLQSERALAIAPAAENGYFMGGLTTMTTGGVGDTSLLVFRVDSAGAVLWARTTGIMANNLADQVQSVAATSDRGCVAAGWTRGLALAADMFVIKFDANGNRQWGRTYGRAGEDRAYSVIATSDGGYAVAGYSELLGMRDIVVMKLDPLGAPVWTRNYSFPPHPVNEGLSICEAPGPVGTRYAVCGRFGPAGGSTCAFVMLVDALNGNPVWPLTQPVITSAAFSTEAWSVAHDGKNLVVAGWSGNWGTGGPLSPNVLIWKLTDAGGYVWSRVYGFDDSEEKAMGDRCLVVDRDTGYVVTGWTTGAGPGSPSPNILFVKVKPENGDLVWSRVHPSQPGDRDEQAYSLTRTDRGFAAAGYTNSNWTTGLDDAHFVTLDTLGNRPVCVLNVPVGVSSPIGSGNLAVTAASEAYALQNMPVDGFGLTRVNICPEIRDGGTWRIFAPTDTIDSTQSVAPACTVWNYGNIPVNIPVNMRIGPNLAPFYNATETAFGLAPGTGARVTYAAYADWPRGRQSVLARTTLAGDTNTANDAALDSVFVRVRDVAATRIIAPIGTIDSTQNITPACSVYNLGNVTETFTVTFTLAGYSDNRTITLAPGSRTLITFGAYADWPRGNWTATCAAALAQDLDPDNNTATEDIVVRVRDVACHVLLQPADGQVIDSGTVIAPACSVANTGTADATFWVRLTIGAYRESLLVSDLPAGSRIQVGPYPAWTAYPVGLVPFDCRTVYALDLIPANDTAAGACIVRHVGGNDVGCAYIQTPVGLIDSGTTVTPACTVRNWGEFDETYYVALQIEDAALYRDSVLVSGHTPGSALYVQFRNWTAAPVGGLTVTCSTKLAVDNTRQDDRRTADVYVQARRPDVGCTRALMPPGNTPVGRIITPACSVYNYGNAVESYQVRLRIAALYDTVVDVNGHAPGTYQHVSFPTWTATPAGLYPVQSFTLLGPDTRRTNDTAYTWVTVRTPRPGAWLEMAPMLSENSGKPAGDGAWLTYNASRDRFYAAKGNKTEDFYSYNPQGNQWLLCRPYPRGTEDRPPAKGSTGCTDGEGVFYTAKGNYTLTFMRYHIEGDTWHQLPGIPEGDRRKRLKGGSSAAYVDLGQPCVYLNKGVTLDFYRYNITDDTWEALDPIPAGTRAKVEYGSWLIHDGSTSLYFHKSRYHELWRFDLLTQKWDTALRLTAMPYTNRAGRTRKSKEGSCADWYTSAAYTLKGANSQDYFRYTVLGDSWTELESVPSYSPNTGRRKLVKGGGAIASRGDGTLYALKGNKTRELWRYTTAAELLSPAPARNGVTASSLDISHSSFVIAPNPLRSGFLSVSFTSSLIPHPSSLSVYDPLGRRILTLDIGHSTSDIDLRALPAGVYLVRLAGNGVTVSQKLVIDR